MIVKITKTKSMENSNKHGRMTFLQTFPFFSGKSQIMNLWLEYDSLLMITGGEGIIRIIIMKTIQFCPISDHCTFKKQNCYQKIRN